MENFEGLALAYQAGRTGGTMPTVFNAANEYAVAKFLKKKIGFLDIERYIIKAVEAAAYIAHPSLEEVIESDAWAREFVHRAWKGGMCTV